jgi:hypothetical protein
LVKDLLERSTKDVEREVGKSLLSSSLPKEVKPRKSSTI